jgi:hypothetical protein
MKKRLMIAAQTLLLAGGMIAFGGVSAPETAHAAKSCGFGWAKPGKYKVSGNFRGRVESTSARLTADCRVSLQIPGVFTGGRVKKSGKCLRFALKVEGQRKVFFAKWCNTYGLVPWKGRNIRAKIKRISIETPSVRAKTNFNN